MKVVSNLILFMFCLVLTVSITIVLAVGAHEHGKSYMTVILDDSILSMSLKLSASDVVGFEYQPTNEKEIEVIGQSTLLLNDTDKWLALTGGACIQKTAKVTSPFDVVTDKHQHEHEHEHEHKNERSVHHDFLVDIEYSCKRAAALVALEVNLQSFFTDIHQIEVQWIIHNKQGLSVIESSNQEIMFNHER